MDLDQAREHAWHSILVNDHNLSDDDAAAALQRYVEEYDALPEPASTPGSFDVLGSFPLPRTTRVTRSACCPDKDLFAVVLRRGSKDRLGLWDLQGTRKWEIQVDLALSEPEYVSAVAWSPDGTSFSLWVIVHSYICRQAYSCRAPASPLHHARHSRWSYTSVYHLCDLWSRGRNRSAVMVLQ
jgi:hypothetical protein